MVQAPRGKVPSGRASDSLGRLEGCESGEPGAAATAGGAASRATNDTAQTNRANPFTYTITSRGGAYLFIGQTTVEALKRPGSWSLVAPRRRELVIGNGVRPAAQVRQVTAVSRELDPEFI